MGGEYIEKKENTNVIEKFKENIDFILNLQNN